MEPLESRTSALPLLRARAIKREKPAREKTRTTGGTDNGRTSTCLLAESGKVERSLAPPMKSPAERRNQRKRAPPPRHEAAGRETVGLAFLGAAGMRSHKRR